MIKMNQEEINATKAHIKKTHKVGVCSHFNWNLKSQNRLTHSPPIHAEKAGNYIVIWHEFKLMNLKRSRRNILTLLCQTVSDRPPGCLLNSHLPQQLLSNEMRDLVRDFSLFPNIIIVIQELLRLLFWLQQYSAVFCVIEFPIFVTMSVAAG